MLDASIYRGINAQQPAPYDPAQTYTKALALRSLVDEGAMRQLQMTQAQQAMADDDAYRAAAREAGGDMMKLRDLLYTKGLPKQGLAVGEAARKGQLDEANIAKSRAETLAKNIGSMRDLIAQATSDADMPIIRDHALRLFGPEGAANVPDRFDPAWQKARIQDAQSKIKALTPNYQTVNAGDRVEMVQMNPDAPGFAPTPIRTGQSPDSVASNATAMRGQNMTDARARDTAERGRVQYDAERGGVVNLDTGAFTPATQNGQPVGPKPEKVTDTQRTAANYAGRMDAAEKLLEAAPKGAQKPGLVEQGARAVGANVGANMSMGEDRQKYRQAQEDWVRAKLRKESGAVIGETEMEREIQTYFPQIGDGAKVIEQKAQARRQAMEGMRVEAAGAYKPAEQPRRVVDW